MWSNAAPNSTEVCVCWNLGFCWSKMKPGGGGQENSDGQCSYSRGIAHLWYCDMLELAVMPFVKTDCISGFALHNHCNIHWIPTLTKWNDGSCRAHAAYGMAKSNWENPRPQCQCLQEIPFCKQTGMHGSMSPTSPRIHICKAPKNVRGQENLSHFDGEHC